MRGITRGAEIRSRVAPAPSQVRQAPALNVIHFIVVTAAISRICLLMHRGANQRCMKRINGSGIVTSPSRMLTNRLDRGSTRTMTITAFEDRPPESAQLTAYDQRHFATYMRLLDADEEGADWQEAVRIIFGVDPDREPERARIVHDSHLARPLDDAGGLPRSPASAPTMTPLF